MLAEADTTEDAVLGGRLVLRQPKRGHRFGHDAILLAAAVDARPGEIAVDIGAGVGTAGLALAHRVPDLKVRLVEVDTTLADLARENAARNRLSDRVSVATLDVAAEPSAFERHGMVGVDHVLMNSAVQRSGHRLARCGAAPRACRGCRRARHVGRLRRCAARGARHPDADLARHGSFRRARRARRHLRRNRDPADPSETFSRRDPHPGPRRPGQRRAAGPAPAAHAQRRGWNTECRGGSGPARRRVAADDGLSRRR